MKGAQYSGALPARIIASWLSRNASRAQPALLPMAVEIDHQVRRVQRKRESIRGVSNRYGLAIASFLGQPILEQSDEFGVGSICQQDAGPIGAFRSIDESDQLIAQRMHSESTGGHQVALGAN